MIDGLDRALENLDGWIRLYGEDSYQVKLLRRLAETMDHSEDDQYAFKALIERLGHEAQPPMWGVGVRAMEVHGLLTAMKTPKTSGTA